MDTPYIGQIVPMAFNFVPLGYAACDGQTLPARQHTALLHLMGTTFGGNGITTFVLPDLRNSIPIGANGQSRDPDWQPQGYPLGEEHSHPTITPAAGDGSKSNGQPYLALRFCIVLEGYFPFR